MSSRAPVILGLVLALGLLPSARSAPFGQGDGDAAPGAVAAADAPRPSAPCGRVVASGKASWYGPRFHGRKTASGEIYDQWKMTAAMTSVRLGTVVQVRRVDTGDTVTVRVNDRGPYERRNGRWVPHRTRVIDLSRKAMERLGGVDAGVIQVQVSTGCPDSDRRSR